MDLKDMLNVPLIFQISTIFRLVSGTDNECGGKCCAYYFREFGTCKACSNGTFRLYNDDDSVCMPCGGGSYGYRCTKLCKCSTTERCDNEFGCVCKSLPYTNCGKRDNHFITMDHVEHVTEEMKFVTSTEKPPDTTELSIQYHRTSFDVWDNVENEKEEIKFYTSMETPLEATESSNQQWKTPFEISDNAEYETEEMKFLTSKETPQKATESSNQYPITPSEISVPTTTMIFYSIIGAGAVGWIAFSIVIAKFLCKRCKPKQRITKKIQFSTIPFITTQEPVVLENDYEEIDEFTMVDMSNTQSTLRSDNETLIAESQIYQDLSLHIYTSLAPEKDREQTSTEIVRNNVKT